MQRDVTVKSFYQLLANSCECAGGCFESGTKEKSNYFPCHPHCFLLHRIFNNLPLVTQINNCIVLMTMLKLLYKSSEFIHFQRDKYSNSVHCGAVKLSISYFSILGIYQKTLIDCISL